MNSGSTANVDPSHVALPCAHCGQPSTRIKSLRTGILVFLGVGAFWRTWTEVGCAACVRARLLQYTGLNLLTAHILWPIAILPWMTVQILRTALEGHSPEILTQLGLPSPPRRSLWVQFQEQWPVGFRIFGLMQMLLGALVFTGMAFILGETWFKVRRIEFFFIQILLAVAGGVAVYLMYSGVSKVLGLAPAVWHRVGVAVLGGLLLPLASPSIARLAWLHGEQTLFAAAVSGDEQDSEYYIRKIPPELWRPAAVEKYVTSRVEQLRREPAVWATSDLNSVRYHIETYHSGNQQFSKIHQQVLKALKH